MPAFLVIYAVLLFVAAVLTLLPARYDKTLYFIAALLFCDLIEELIHFYTDRYIVYHLFVPVYYDLFACYFLANIHGYKSHLHDRKRQCFRESALRNGQ